LDSDRRGIEFGNVFAVVASLAVSFVPEPVFANLAEKIKSSCKRDQVYGNLFEELCVTHVILGPGASGREGPQGFPRAVSEKKPPPTAANTANAANGQI